MLEPHGRGRAPGQQALPRDERPAAAVLAHGQSESAELIVRPDARVHHAAGRIVRERFCLSRK